MSYPHLRCVAGCADFAFDRSLSDIRRCGCGSRSVRRGPRPGQGRALADAAGSRADTSPRKCRQSTSSSARAHSTGGGFARCRTPGSRFPVAPKRRWFLGGRCQSPLGRSSRSQWSNCDWPHDSACIWNMSHPAAKRRARTGTLLLVAGCCAATSTERLADRQHAIHNVVVVNCKDL